MSTYVLRISKDGDCGTFLGNLCHCLVTLTVNKNYVLVEFLAFQFVHITSSPITSHHWEESGSIFFTILLQLSIFVDKMPLSVLFSRLNSSLSFSSCSKCSKPLNIIVDLQWPCTSMCLLSWRAHQWAEYSRSVPPELSRGKGHPSQPAGNFCIIQSRMLLTFFAPRTHCWFMSSLPTKFPRVFSAKLLSNWSSACTAEWGYSSPGVGLGT